MALWTPAAVLLLVTLLSDTTGAADRVVRARDVVARQQTQFGLDMYSVMARTDRSVNIFFSPVSIGTALAMAYAGCRGNTATQMEEVLHFEQSKGRTARGHRGLMHRIQRRYQQGGVTVRMTNRMYTSERLRVKQRFSRRVERLFGAKLERLDFTQPRQAAARINENVERDTAGHITDMMDPSSMNANMMMVLMNAIYFKGAWLMQFERNQTAEADFHSPSGTRSVQMMRTKKQFPVGHVRSLNSRALKLPYKGEDISMLILLPNEMDGIHQLEDKLSTALLNDIIWSLESDYDVEVQLPRFKMEEKIDLKEMLKKMGMTDLFDQDAANLRGITSRQQIFVSDAIHKAAIELSEEGTTAAAATALGFSFRMMRPRPEPFIVDRPFFFVLRDEKTGATLFMGRVLEP